jgi:signal transduction histidine kinase
MRFDVSRLQTLLTVLAIYGSVFASRGEALMSVDVQSVHPEAKAHLFPLALARRINRRNVVPITAALLVAAAMGDYVTGVDVTCTLLYLFPIALGTWFRDRAFGVVLSATATASGVATSLLASDHHHSARTVAWNATGTLCVFLVVVWLLDMLRSYVDEEQRKRGLAISQLRHAERLNVIGTLAAGVAHELGTPLNVITVHAELIDRDDVPRERVHKACETIQRQAKKMAQIISNLLDFGRRGGLAREKTSLTGLVATAASLLGPMAMRARCAIAAEDAGRDVTALVNPGEVEQVLANLILNAIQAMPDGGTVRVGCEVERAGDSNRRGTSYACLTVEDEGSGISPSDLPRIFDPFFTTKGVGRGTGLGLSVTYGIVQDHGGTIHVESEMGRGSRFVVRLPLSE